MEMVFCRVINEYGTHVFTQGMIINMTLLRNDMWEHMTIQNSSNNNDNNSTRIDISRF